MAQKKEAEGASEGAHRCYVNGPVSLVLQHYLETKLHLWPDDFPLGSIMQEAAEYGTISAVKRRYMCSGAGDCVGSDWEARYSIDMEVVRREKNPHRLRLRQLGLVSPKYGRASKRKGGVSDTLSRPLEMANCKQKPPFSHESYKACDFPWLLKERGAACYHPEESRLDTAEHLWFETIPPDGRRPVECECVYSKTL